MDPWRKLVDAVLNGDEHFAAGNYDEAHGSFMIASDRSRFTDHAGQLYIERRLLQINLLKMRKSLASRRRTADAVLSHFWRAHL